MQVGAVNSLKFGNGYNIDDTEQQEKIRNAKIAQFEQKVLKIKSNVRPETCLLTAATIGLAVAKGKMFADLAVKSSVLASTVAASTLTKAGGAAAGLFTKVVKKGDYINPLNEKSEKIFNNGVEFARNIGNKAYTTAEGVQMKGDEAFNNNVDKCVKIFFDGEKGENISNFITQKLGINSKSGLLTSLVACFFGWKAGDGGGDLLENVLDNKEIEKEYTNLFASDKA